MSDETDGFSPEDYEGLQEKQETVTAKWRRQLEKRAKEGDQAKAELAQVRRELALSKAGIPDSKLGQLFLKAYDGPTDDVDAIKAAAIEYGVLQASEGLQRQVNQSLAGHEAATAAAAGAPAPGNVDVGALLAGAKNAEEVARIAHEHLGPQALDQMGMTGRR